MTVQNDKEFLRIVALCIGAAVFYGLIHDQITARLCLEYFTVAHPPVVVSDSPTVQGLVWGVIATWWVGFLLGVPLAIVSLTGDYPPWTAKRLVRPIGILLATMAVCAASAGFLAYELASSGRITIAPGWADAITPEHHAPFVAVAWTHNVSYLSGFVGGIVLIFSVWNARCGNALRAALR